MSDTATVSARSITSSSLYPHANYIDGAWVSEGDGTFNTVIDKYHGTELARIPHATEAQMEDAIAAAYSSRDAVRKLSAGERSAKLEALASLIAKHEEELAMLIVQEGGKPIGYAKTEIARCITTVRTAAAEALRFTGESVALDYGAGAGKTAFTKRFPIGVIAAITPFNFPLNLVLHKVAPAMAVGCPVVLKPAPQAPLSSLALGKLIEQVGWPKGAFSVLMCGVPVAEKLVKDERVAMLSFTGSDKVGWHLKAICGKKKVALELGVVLAGGKPFDAARNIYGATLLTGTKSEMKVTCAEVFGPVAILEEVADFGEAIARVNDSTYGLQAGVFTDSVANMKRAHDELEVGGIIMNNVPGFRLDSMPYGGIKDSGLGREGVKYAMEEMSEPRLIVY
ncbi:MAG: aldehyde dehydrogenase family protein [Flavobacteriales bacterium]|nr:aldehyde dehydrogenase family protein [Flavobacteriales bacterium]